MEKNLKKPLSIFLGCSLISTLLTGCNPLADTGSLIGESSSVLDPKNTVYEGPIIPGETTEVSTSNLIETLDSKTMTTYELNQILEHPEDYPVSSQIIASYNNLKLFGLSLDDVREELHNILVFSQVPRCMSEEEYFFAVGKLGITTTNNPFSVYIELAKVVHLEECKDEHSVTDYGVFTCDSLAKEYNDNYREIPIDEYLDDKLGDDEDYLTLKSFFKDGLDVNELVRELEIMVKLGLMPPTDFDEETWWSSFYLLLGTLDPSDILFDKYIPLAMRVHNAMYPDDQLVLSNDVNYLARERKIVN